MLLALKCIKNCVWMQLMTHHGSYRKCFPHKLVEYIWELVGWRFKQDDKWSCSIK